MVTLVIVHREVGMVKIASGGALLRPALFTALLLAVDLQIPPHPALAERNEDAVVLEERLEVDILSESEARVRYLNRTQVLTPRGVERYGDAWVGYNPSVTIKELRASVTSPSGKRQEIKKQQISDSSAFASFELYSDARQRGIHFAGAETGSTLEYSYEESMRGLFYLPDLFLLQAEIPARNLSYTVRAPVSLPLRISVRGTPTYTREEREGTVTHHWEVKDVPPFKDESNAPPEEDLLPRVAIYPRRLSLLDQRIDAESWDGIAGWNLSLARDRMNPGPAVAEAAKAATAGVQEPEEKIRRLYEFLQQKITYVAVEMGVGGWQPHDNAQVFQHRYGDCKDKATLLIAMLRAVGLNGLPVLIRTRDKGLIESDYPSSAFNHVIVAIPRPEGYLFLDPTSEDTPYGDLPWVDQGVPVLVVKEDGRGDLVETPLTPADKNRTHRQVSARITSTGGLEGEYSVEFWGADRQAVQEFLQSGKTSEKEDALEDVMSGLCPGATMKEYRVSPAARPQDPVKIVIQFEMPRYVIKAGSAELISPVLARFPHFSNLVSASSRRFPAFFPALFAETSEVQLHLPPGHTVARMPADRKSEGPGLEAATSYAMVRDEGGETLVVKRSLTVSRREIPPADYPALKEFFSGLAREDAGAVGLVSKD
jgi:hypothetical protein